MAWIAHFHYIFVHFPIALITMAAIAELIMYFRKSNELNTTVNFLLVSAALFIIPTVFTGLNLEDIVTIQQEANLTLELHEAFAFTTLALAFVTVFLRYWLPARRALYLLSFILLFLCVNITAYFGGEMAFGPLF